MTLINMFLFPRFPMKYYLYWLKWQGWFSSSPSLTYTKQHIHKNLTFKPYSLCNFVSWVSRTIYEQFLLIVCVLHLSLTWSLTYVDNLTTVVYLKQNKRNFQGMLLIGVYLTFLSLPAIFIARTMMKRSRLSFVSAKLNVPCAVSVLINKIGKWSHWSSEFRTILWKGRQFCLEFSKPKYQSKDQALDSG